MYTKKGVFHLITDFYHSFSYNCLHLDTCIDQLTKEVLRQISANRGSQWKTLMHNLHVILHFNPRYHKVNLSWNRNLIRKVFWLKERSHCCEIICCCVCVYEILSILCKLVPQTLRLVRTSPGSGSQCHVWVVSTCMSCKCFWCTNLN